MRHHTTDIRIRLLMHIHQKTKTFLLRVIVTQGTLMTQTHTVDWTVPVFHKLQGGVPVGYDKKRHPHIAKDSSQLRISMILFSEIIQLLVEQTDITTSTWTHWTKEGPHRLT